MLPANTKHEFLQLFKLANKLDFIIFSVIMNFLFTCWLHPIKILIFPAHRISDSGVCLIVCR